MEKKYRIGVFGCWRGASVANCLKIAGAEIVAACDKEEKRLEAIKPQLAENAGIYTDFDAFLDHDMDAVLVTNYYAEHVPYAIRLLERGISVLSECASNITMAEGVALVRAVEASGAKYMLIENYPYSAACQELARVYQTGKLGRVIFGEGEYVHPMAQSELLYYAPGERHWRTVIPPTYYNTHALGPIMQATGAMPLTVSAVSVSRPELSEGTPYQNDVHAPMMCKMDDGSVFTFTGWSRAAGHSSWYRLGCTKGIAEIGRFDGGRIRVIYNAHDKPEDEPRDALYAPDFPFDADKAKKCGHGGGDYFIAKQFLEVLAGEREPFFDVYRATAMASCGILGWRSCLEGGQVYRIPDFRREEDKKLYENDHRSPFASENDPNYVPCSVEGN